MKVFVTGASGFVGSAVVRELGKRGHRVYTLKSRLENIAAVERELRRAKPDVVMHLAWSGLPDVSDRPSMANLINSARLFHLVYSLGIRKLVAVGSCWEYDDAIPTDHRMFVAVKKSLRLLGEALAKETGGQFIWSVLFFVYGAGKKSVSLIPSLIRSAQTGNIPMPKNPNAWHDFVYLDDVARALVVLATKKKTESGSYDVGSGHLTRTGDIARMIARMVGVPAPQLKKVSKKGRRADIRTLRKMDWSPRTGIQEGLQHVLKEL